MVATTLAESASLWAIRIAMLVLVAVLAAEICGYKRTQRWLAWLWLVGGMLALAHSLGSLVTFHHGSQSEALESTAMQTQQLLGFRFGAGLYVNYAFVLIWMMDGIMRLIAPIRYEELPKSYRYAIDGFLIFIAINGAIVFKAGVVRAIGLVCVVGLIALSITKRRWHV